MRLRCSIPLLPSTQAENHLGGAARDVVRKAYTAYNGISLFGTETGLAIKGGGLKKGWELNIPSYVDAAKASIVVVVSYNDGANKEVIQCTEVKLQYAQSMPRM